MHSCMQKLMMEKMRYMDYFKQHFNFKIHKNQELNSFLRSYTNTYQELNSLSKILQLYSV